MQHKRVKDQTYSPSQESPFVGLHAKTELEGFEAVAMVRKRT